MQIAPHNSKEIQFKLVINETLTKFSSMNYFKLIEKERTNRNQ